MGGVLGGGDPTTLMWNSLSDAFFLRGLFWNLESCSSKITIVCMGRCVIYNVYLLLLLFPLPFHLT